MCRKRGSLWLAISSHSYSDASDTEEFRICGDQCDGERVFADRTASLGTQQASSPKLDRLRDVPKPSLPPGNKTKRWKKLDIRIVKLNLTIQCDRFLLSKFCETSG